MKKGVVYGYCTIKASGWSNGKLLGGMGMREHFKEFRHQVIIDNIFMAKMMISAHSRQIFLRNHHFPSKCTWRRMRVQPPGLIALEASLKPVLSFISTHNIAN